MTMRKNRHTQAWLSGCLVAALGLAGVWLLSDDVRAARASGHGHAKVSLGDSMSTIQSGYRFVARNYKDPAKHADCLVRAEAILKAATEGRFDLPESVQKAPAAEREELTQIFRAQMCDLIIIAANLEKGLLQGDMAAIKEAVGDLKAIKKAGHTRFIED